MRPSIRKTGIRSMGMTVLALVTLAATASAQSIHARVFDSLGVRPLSGAVVQVVTPSGALVGRALTSSDGRASIEVGRAGRFTLLVEMIGRESRTLDLELFDDLLTVRREIRLSDRPISIEGLEVAAAQRCMVAPEAGEALRRVWDEARKGLLATAATEEEGLYDFETMVYERDLDRELIRLQNLDETRKESTASAPFVTKPADDLLSHGFVERTDGSDVYYAPDAYLLLSDAFLRSHCFALESRDASDDDASALGLTFEPLTTVGERIDIRGTLWLDAETLELGSLEYRYTNLPPVRRDERVGGEVRFQKMPEGRWIVTEWFIRMPSISLRRDRDYRLQEFVSGFREAGGVVVEARRSGGDVLQGDRLGSLSGTVEGPHGAPLESVRVDLEGTSRSVVTEADGSFAFEGLPEGFYQLLATDARWRSLGLSPAVRGTYVSPEDPSVVLIRLDADNRILSECREEIPPRPVNAPAGPWPPGEGALAVEVVDGADRPISGTPVQVEWVKPGIAIRMAPPSGRGAALRPSATSDEVPVVATVLLDGLSYAGITDAAGRVRFCGLPEGPPLTVTAEGADGPLADVTVRLEDGVRVRRVVVRPPAR